MSCKKGSVLQLTKSLAKFPLLLANFLAIFNMSQRYFMKMFCNKQNVLQFSICLTIFKGLLLVKCLAIFNMSHYYRKVFKSYHWLCSGLPPVHFVWSAWLRWTRIWHRLPEIYDVLDIRSEIQNEKNQTVRYQHKRQQEELCKHKRKQRKKEKMEE